MINSKRNKDLYIIISSSCKLTQGKFRSVIVDYDREEVYYIDNEFAKILSMLNGKTLRFLEDKMDDRESINNLYDFLDFLEEKEIIFFTSTPQYFPKRKDSIKETPSILDNLIIEINSNIWNIKLEKCILQEISNCLVSDLQIRIVSIVDYNFLYRLLNKIEGTGVKYIELICSINHISSIEVAKNLLQEVPLLSNVYIFECEEYSHQSINSTSKTEKITFGDIFLLKDRYNHKESCGIINLHTLDFSGIDSYNLLKIKNGCLYKKASIDCNGYIHNCPSIEKKWGNVLDNDLKTVVLSDNFSQCWNIHKDLIDECKDCELRYCCTDCRANVEIYSKPRLCQYNIKKGVWH